MQAPPHGDPLSIPDLRAAIHGRVVAPDDPDYDAGRAVFIGDIDDRPAVIVRVADVADVTYVVGLARRTGMELAVRGGGHSNAGHGTTDGGIVLDLRDLKSLEVDAAGRTSPPAS
jgi:FAD/FMN-containing dehydrogenase